MCEESWYHRRSLTHHSQFSRLGIQCPTLVCVMFIGSGLMGWVSFYSSDSPIWLVCYAHVSCINSNYVIHFKYTYIVSLLHTVKRLRSDRSSLMTSLHMPRMRTQLATSVKNRCRVNWLTIENVLTVLVLLSPSEHCVCIQCVALCDYSTYLPSSMQKWHTTKQKRW